ncbi:MAG: hypothetical protein Q7U04_14465 [Bacteriovorax sp.]|nr:hypothetical protein [Bacteriovorax sp.]
MKKEKHDLLSDTDFIKLNLPKKKHHYPLPSDVIPEDENSDQLRETLLGMEYDLESPEDRMDDDLEEDEQEESRP